MQRVNNYRVYRKDTKEWGEIIGYDKSDDGEWIHIKFYTSDGQAYYEKWYRVSDEDIVIMEYTGLKDKNGKEIYEGDILRDSLGWVFVVVWDDDDARFIGHHAKTRGETYICYVGREPKAEIIGSIYDNPELLQEVDK